MMNQSVVFRLMTVGVSLAALSVAGPASAALSLDRTRVILDGDEHAVAMTVTNENPSLPYLAQAWVEDAQGKKTESPLTAVPPLQRVEPRSKTQVKVQLITDRASLPRDRESLFYFNLREIPPRSDKPNTLQLALQTRLKLFYRPEALKVTDNSQPWQEKITLTREGEHYRVSNPTPYFVTLTAAAPRENADSVKGFEPLMIEPEGHAILGGRADALGNQPVITYVNDYGGRPVLIFSCAGSVCAVKSTKAG